MNKKKQKNFINLGRAGFAAIGPKEQKFLRRFFQKAAAFFGLGLFRIISFSESAADGLFDVSRANPPPCPARRALPCGAGCA
ncbi:MAG TPA: hypothetical protein VNC39_12125 [Acidocella sp.]|uniref:hypothetical protein n=1 Tax=Acidocella sp. TaxID=50710 RepID=UPI002C08B285|nr:hypothetical protein [Acidocella sp.]HVE22716.1 hypothetical protein [Acidocella sp.]